MPTPPVPDPLPDMVTPFNRRSSNAREAARERRRAEILAQNKRTKRLDALTIIGVLLITTPLVGGILALATGAVWWAALWLWTNLPI